MVLVVSQAHKVLREQAVLVGILARVVLVVTRERVVLVVNLVSLGIQA